MPMPRRLILVPAPADEGTLVAPTGSEVMTSAMVVKALLAKSSALTVVTGRADSLAMRLMVEPVISTFSICSGACWAAAWLAKARTASVTDDKASRPALG